MDLHEHRNCAMTTLNPMARTVLTDTLAVPVSMVIALPVMSAGSSASC